MNRHLPVAAALVSVLLAPPAHAADATTLRADAARMEARIAALAEFGGDPENRDRARRRPGELQAFIEL